MPTLFVVFYFLIIFGVLAIILLKWYIKNNYSYSALYMKALEAYEEAEYDKAKRLFLACLQKESESKDARYNLGLTFMKLEEYKFAKGCFERVREIDPKDFDTLYNLGLANFCLQDYKKAREHFDGLLEMDKENSNTLFNIGLTCQMQKEYSEAEGFYKQAISKNEQDVDSHLNWGIICFEREQYVKALDLFKTADDLSYERTDIMFLIARCKDELCSYNTDLEAQEAINRYIELQQREDKPADLEVYLARSYAKAGYIQDAVKICEQAFETAPKSPVLLRLSGLLKLLSGDLNDAQEHLSKTINMDINNIEGYKLLSYVYAQKGDTLKQVEMNSKCRTLREREKLSAER